MMWKDKLHVPFVNQVDIKIRTDNHNAKKIAMLDRTLMLHRLHALIVNKVNIKIKIGSQRVKMIAMTMVRILTVTNRIVLLIYNLLLHRPPVVVK